MWNLKFWTVIEPNVLYRIALMKKLNIEMVMFQVWNLPCFDYKWNKLFNTLLLKKM